MTREELIQYINSVIVDNDSGEITAKTLREVLISMSDAIGEGGGGSSEPSLPQLINVVQTLGNSTKDVISQAGVTREFNAVREEADEKLTEAKAYTDKEIAKAAIGGGGDIIPELPDLAKVAKTGDYNDLKNKPTIPDVSGLATKESLNTKQNKTAIVTATDAVIAGNRSVIDVTGDVVISLIPYEEDGYAHAYEIVLNVGDTAYSVAFPESVKWVKGLEIEANTTYSIVIEDNLALYVAIK